jgi:hypothetical protein
MQPVALIVVDVVTIATAGVQLYDAQPPADLPHPTCRLMAVGRLVASRSA